MTERDKSVLQDLDRLARGIAHIDRVREEKVTMSERADRALRSNALFVRFLVLVLSIAVLVLVLDRSIPPMPNQFAG